MTLLGPSVTGDADMVVVAIRSAVVVVPRPAAGNFVFVHFADTIYLAKIRDFGPKP